MGKTLPYVNAFSKKRTPLDFLKILVEVSNSLFNVEQKLALSVFSFTPLFSRYFDLNRMGCTTTMLRSE